MKIFKILILFFMCFMIPVHADNIVQITCGGGQQKICSVKHKHKHNRKYVKNHKIKRYFVTKKTYKLKQYVKVQPIQKQRQQYPEIYQNTVEINNSQVYINPVVEPQQIQTPTPQPQPIQQIPVVVVKPVLKHSNLLFKAGVNTFGSMKMTCEDESETVDLDNSIFIGTEYTLMRDSHFEGGIGALCEFNKNYNAIPVYGFLKYQLEQINLTGSLGYNFFAIKDKPDNVEVKNGLYYAIGIEAPVNSKIKLFTEYLTYTNLMKIDCPCRGMIDLDFVYNKLALGVKVEI